MTARAPRPWSLRRRLTRRVLAVVLGAWVITVALSALVLDHEMDELFDQELRALVETTVLFVDAAQGQAIPRTLGVETQDGERVLRILSPAPAPDVAAGAVPWGRLDTDGFHDSPGWRILRHSADGIVIEAAHATTWRHEEFLEALAAFLVLVLPLVGLLVLGLGRIVAQATAPVVRLAGAVGARSPNDLSPLAAQGLPQEVAPLAIALDGYLARIDRARAAERDFIANAAHELRTPLAALRNTLALSPDPDAARAVRMVDALTRRVERLLHLSRAEAGLALDRGPADLLRILRLLIDEIGPRGTHPVVLDDGDLDRLDVAADPDALAIVLRNLIENAQDHGTGPVRITLAPDGTLSIRNPAKAPVLPHARFTPRPGSLGTGLGLSISRALAQAMQVPMSAKAGVDHVLVTLRFPLHSPNALFDQATGVK